MPRFKVDRKCSRTLVASLIDITGSGVICTQRRYNPVRVAVGTRNVGASEKKNTLEVENVM